jgi:hypothetical protein
MRDHRDPDGDITRRQLGPRKLGIADVVKLLNQGGCLLPLNLRLQERKDLTPLIDYGISNHLSSIRYRCSTNRLHLIEYKLGTAASEDYRNKGL